MEFAQVAAFLEKC